MFPVAQFRIVPFDDRLIASSSGNADTLPCVDPQECR